MNISFSAQMTLRFICRHGMRPFILSLILACLTLCWGPTKVAAVINPALQPDIYYQQYDNVIVLEITDIDIKAGTLTCQTVKAIKGSAYKAGAPVTIQFMGEMTQQVAARTQDNTFVKGYRFPVFAGKPSRRRKNRQIRMYADMFYVGEVKKVGHWEIGVADGTETDSEGKLINTLAGIYCGMTDQLIKLLEQTAEGTDFYPRKAYVKFKPDALISQFKGSVEAVAMYDINGDGMEDLVACSPAGDRVIFQLKPMQFTDVTEAVGLKTASRSCNLVDVNHDGLTDILLDTTIYQGKFEQNQFSFVKTDWLNAGDAKALKSAAYVELNGDGYPDVVISEKGNGLRAFEHTGKKIGYKEVTQAIGLTEKDCGAGGNGYFMAGDWNGDRKMDLFYAHGDGYLLVAQDGRFQPVKHEIDFIFKTGLDEYGRTGAGVFMPTMSPDRIDMMVPIEKDWLVIGNDQGRPVDISKWGNEISEGSDLHLATVASDLNVDGYVDIYTISDQKKENRYIINRGYGSYMHAKVHVDEKPLFKGPAHGSGGRSLAVGDINDDGAPDILIGNQDGMLLLIENDTLSMRVEKEHMKKDERRLLGVRLVTARILGPKGVINSQVRLLDSQGEVVSRHDLGTNIATGCRGPDLVTFAVRDAGKYTVKVTYADGHEVTMPADVTTDQRISLVLQRQDQKEGANAW